MSKIIAVEEGIGFKSQGGDSSARGATGLATAVFGRPVRAPVDGLRRGPRSHAGCALGGRRHVGRRTQVTVYPVGFPCCII